jgi:hypothetical protein
VILRQSYARVGKHALIKHQRYAHAHQFKRAGKALRTLKTQLGRVIRDIERRIKGKSELEEAFAKPLHLAGRDHKQDRRQRGPKVDSLHAPEVECIGKGKAHKPYEFGVKVSVATPVYRCKGGQFVAHVQALPGNPYDGHTLAKVIPAAEAQIGASLSRIVADAGYRGHNPPKATSSRSTRQARSEASPRPSSVSSNDDPPSSPSSVISNPTTGWTAITSPIPAAMPSMPSSPPSATTSACSSGGLRFFEPKSWPHSARLARQPIVQSPPEWRSSRSTQADDVIAPSPPRAASPLGTSHNPTI